VSETTTRPERIHFFQLRDAAGVPAERDFVVPLDHKLLLPVSVSLAQQLRPLKPRLTYHPGVYWYLEEGVGSGWLRVEETDPVDVESLHELMVAADLGLAAGHEEPWPVDRSMLGQIGAPRAGNPYIMIGWGALLIGVACFGVIRFFSTDGFGGGPAGISAGILMVLLIGVSTALIVRGAKRLAWWHAARAEARRRGIPLPEKLTGTGA
jgi:hypothetical protein